MNKSILIYKDHGVGPIYASVLWNDIHELGYAHTYEIRWVNRDFIVNENWENQATTLIIPGGKDISYHELLKGKGNARIKAFVENGGSYLGICAGAYYGCATLEFDIGFPNEVIGNRELQFFPGMAKGPAFGNGTFFYHDERTGRIAKMGLYDNTVLASYHNGGCYFVDAENQKNTKIIARYLDIPGQPAAIIQCNVGKGKAILCGPHPEIGAYNLTTQDPHFLKIKPALENIETQRKELFQMLLSAVAP